MAVELTQGTDVGAAGRRWSRVDLAALGVLALVVWWVCRGNLGISDLFPDDANRALAAKAHSWHQFHVAAFTETGQVAVVALMLRLFHHSATAAQVPAFVMGLVGPMAVYWAARRYGIARWGALAGGVVLAVGNVQSFHATTLKPNTWASAFTAILIGLAAPLVMSPDSDAGERRDWLLLAGAMGVASMCTVYGVMATLVVGVVVLVVRRWHRTPLGRFGWGAMAAVGVWLMVLWAVVLRGSQDVASNPIYGRLSDHHFGFLVKAVGDVLYGVAPWSASAHKERLVGWALGALTLAGMAVLVRRRNPLAVMCLAPVLMAFALAGLHLAPIGLRFDAWFYPAICLPIAALVGLVAGRLPAAAVWAGCLVVALAVFVKVDAAVYPQFRPSMKPLAAALADVPADQCVVLNGVQLAQFQWDTNWEVSLASHMAREPWVRAGFPGRCVSVVNSPREWLEPGVLTTAAPPGATVWWVRPAGSVAQFFSPPTAFTVAESRTYGGWDVLRLDRVAISDRWACSR